MQGGCEVLALDFTEIARGILGAEGPVFSKSGDFYLVAPEVEDQDKNPIGEIIRLDVDNSQVNI